MNKMLCWALVTGGVAVVMAALGCGTARRDAPLTAKPSDALEDAKLVRGKVAFDNNCYQCHPGGDSGLAPAINNKPAPKALIKTQVRAGLGAMPSFSEEQISDQQLEEIASYLKHLRAQKIKS